MRTFVKEIHSVEVDKARGKSTTIDELEYTIPDGAVLAVRSLTAGHEFTRREARIELVYRDGSDSLIRTVYASGTTITLNINEDFVGNGSNMIVIRLINGDRGELHMTAMWEGFLDG